MTDVHITRGASPLIVSFPHVGTDVPDDIAARMTPAALRLDDTDFAQPDLYDFTDELEATTVTARWSRLVIDVNRPPDNTPLYPGQWGAGLVPTETFLGEQVYQGAAPDAAEIDARRDRFWRPYHNALKAAIEAAVEAHGFALLWDAHSISAVVPRLFEGTLPDLNMGTAGGAACGEEARAAAFGVCRASGFSAVLDGRFKGGFITRTYGAPEKGVHAIQMELAKSTHLGPDNRIDAARAGRLRPVLESAMEAALDALGDGLEG
ncbi:MAG: N-formylglutamate deformylase [Caulobacter sp.]|nr:N-formylglutamate deformylase [Caulobacter sp.]